MAPVVSSDDSRLFGLVQSKQVAVIPARIDYTIDLSQMNRDRMAWNAQTQTLSVRLPPLRLSRPNLDEAGAILARRRVDHPRRAGQADPRHTRLAEQLATQQAANPVLMGLAQCREGRRAPEPGDPAASGRFRQSDRQRPSMAKA
jgi:hypothetical protein